MSARSAVVLIAGMLVGAGLVELGAWSAAAPLPAPLVMVLTASPPAAPAPVVTAVPPGVPAAPAAPVAAKVGPREPAPKTLRARKKVLSELPDGVVARLRRPEVSPNAVVSRELIAGANALERGTAYTAWAHFTRALQLDHDNHDALMGVALCHYELNQKAAVDRALNRLLSLDPSHPEASILRGFMAQLDGDASAATDWYERALPRLENDATADELRSVIAMLRTQVTRTPAATARAERSR